MTRLDKYLCDSGILTRSEASRAVRSGRVAVNGVQLRDPSAKIDEKTASVTLDSKEIVWKKYRDGKKITDLKLPFFEHIALNEILKKAQGTDIEKILKESGAI